MNINRDSNRVPNSLNSRKLQPQTKSQQQSFDTSDTVLAAWLHSQGIELLSVDITSFPSVFHFSPEEQSLPKFIRQYETATAQGNIVLFFRSYKLMLSRIKDFNNRFNGNER